MANLIEERVKMAREGANPYVITRMASGWLVIGDHQVLPGYCLLLGDPVVESLNGLDEESRIRYSLDMIRIGDALITVTGAFRINYLTLGNLEPALHTHIVPRYLSEPEDKRRDNAFKVYDRASWRRTDPEGEDCDFMERMRRTVA
jgi:diadenosine tetraphosphate (Ap4A) HIT family hydrolase